MKNKYKVTLLLSGLLLLNSPNYAQKNYVNLEWENSTGEVGPIQRTASALDNNDNLIVVSNTVNSSNTTDVLITKYTPDGVILWQQTYSGSANGNDYGVQLKVNNLNEIFIAASLEENTGVDFGILKYSPNGALIWANSWNGAANGIDVPADIDIDNSGNIFLVGGTQSSNGFSDYAVVKFHSDGVYQWHTTYDHASLHDAATSMSFNANNIVVSGASASTPTNWDYATLEINKTNGTIINIKRTVVPGVGLDNAVAVTSDVNNNTYITGYVEENGNRNIQTVKLNSNFGLEWVKNFEGGLEDVAKAIGIDNFGNVYIAGTKENPNGGKDYITIKYDQNGTEIWNREFGSGGSDLIATAENLAILGNGDVIVTGTLDQNNEKEFATVKYTSTGDLKFVQKFDAGNQNNEAKSVIVKNDNIYVTGITEINGVNQNTTVKYRDIERTLSSRIVNGVESHIKNEIIIRFDRSVLNFDAIDKKGFVAGRLNEFVTPNVINDINKKLNMDVSRFKTFKIHKGATSADTLSYTRLGDTIRLSDFWASLIIEFPNIGSEELIADSIESVSEIHYAQVNSIYKPNDVPNDLFYNDYQLGFYPNATYPNSDINVVGAWEILKNKEYPIGSESVKVKMYDYLIDYTHFEFSATGQFVDSKIKDGKNYHNGVSIENSYPQNTTTSHGTAVAGIIAANRNDGAGIAGIAGGDLSSFPFNNGVELYSYGIHWLNSSATSAIVSEALYEGSSETNTGFGYGFNIANHSYGAVGFPDPEVLRALKDSWRNNTVNVAARGNNGHAGNPLEFPGCYADKMIINVAASGTDGNRKKNGNGDDTQNIHWESSYGRDGNNPEPACYIDVMAPGVTELVSTTVNKDHFIISTGDSSSVFLPDCEVPMSQNSSNYSCFNGTSAAAAHISGVSSLMYSAHDPINNPYYKNKLTTEDIENILQKTTFKLPNEYSHNDGYGLVNSEEAVKQVVLPYSVLHKTYTLSNADIEFLGASNDPNLNIHIYGAEEDLGVSSNQVFKTRERYKAKWTINYTPTDSEIIDWWKVEARTNGGQFPGGGLNSPTFFYQKDPFFIENLNVDINLNNVSGVVEGYYYKFTRSDGSFVWAPKNPNLDLRYTFALHLKGDADLSVKEENIIDNIIVYPNPSGSEISIKNIPASVSKYNLSIYDTSGRLIESKEITNPNEKINVMNLSEGLYYLRLESKSFNSFTKFIKQ